MSEEHVNLIIEMLMDKDWNIAHDAAMSLAEIGPKIIPLLLDTLRDKDKRFMASLAIQKMGTSALPFLYDSLKDSSHLIRYESIKIIGLIANSDSISVILPYLEDSLWYVRRAAVEALRTIGDPNVISKLYEKRNDQNLEVRTMIENTLKELEKNKNKEL